MLELGDGVALADGVEVSDGDALADAVEVPEGDADGDGLVAAALVLTKAAVSTVVFGGVAQVVLDARGAVVAFAA